jgi:transglutaminase-like putative cysteine protease
VTLVRNNRFGIALSSLAILLWNSLSCASGAPDWMRSLASAPLPPHDEKTSAVVLHADAVLTVQPNGSMRRHERVAYKILRPDGKDFASVILNFDPQSRITSLHGWTIPVTGKDFEVKEKEIFESAVIGVDGSELISDARVKLMQLPAATPGSIVGYEVERELRPFPKMDTWDFQETIPVKESQYTLRIPNGWSYKATWINYSEQPPVMSTTKDAGITQWTVSDLRPVRIESLMPPWRGIAGRLVISLVPASGQDSGPQSWREIGLWYAGLTADRRIASPEIRKQALELTGSATSSLQKMRALAEFSQNNVRYVAIELGIGGHQPHKAADIYKNRFGDCKDKATLMSTLLKEIGIESYYAVINTTRGSVTPASLPDLAFNHVVMAIALPDDVNDASLTATIVHPRLGRLLFFDPTDELTPLGSIRGELQDNYALLVTPDGGEMVGLPKVAASSTALERTAQMTLDATGLLKCEVKEELRGDAASRLRGTFKSMAQDIERVKPIESEAAESLASFEITNASIKNRTTIYQPLQIKYALEAAGYAKVAGDMLLVRPRILGVKSSALLETREPRENNIEFEGPKLDKDVFEIEIPAGYRAEDLPPAVNVDEGFAAYHSKTEVVGNKLRYVRSFEIKELSVPVAKADRLKLLYRTIHGDEGRVAVLKKVAQ